MSSKVFDSASGSVISEERKTSAGITSITIAGLTGGTIAVEAKTPEDSWVPVMGPDLTPVSLTQSGLYTFDSSVTTLRLNMASGTGTVNAWIK